MSLVTRCPACHTGFKVVADQLRISSGWVRCGRCAEVFDGRAHLVDLSARAEVIPEAAALQVTAAPVPVVQAPQKVVAEPVPFGVPQPEPALAEPLDSRIVPEEAPTAGPVVEPVASESKAEGDADPEVQQDDPVPDVGFLRDSRRRRFWRHPVVRVLQLLCAIALAGLLVVQWAYVERNALAARWPQAREPLTRLCAALGCQLGAWRSLDAVIVEGSSFNRARADQYRFSYVLRNQAALDVALPALELTLVDAPDQILVRRVFSPTELGAPSAALAAGREWAGALALRLPDIDARRINGYRVLAFYP